MRGDCALYVPRQIARSARIVCRAEPVTEIVARESTNERAAPWTIQAARTTPRATTAAAPTRASLHIPLLIVVRSFPVAAPVENRDVGESPRGGCVPEPSIRRLAAVHRTGRAGSGSCVPALDSDGGQPAGWPPVAFRTRVLRPG